jgi:fucose permease
MSHMQRTAGSRLFLLIVAYLGFVSLGLPDTLIGVAWPSVRETFHLPQSCLAFIFCGAGLSYFLSSFFTGKLLDRLGIGLLLAGSSVLVALSNFGYALAPIWLLFASCSLLHGLGSGAIDAGLNHYVAQHFPARHMNWLHACYSLGATFGPLIMTAMLARSGSWRMGYLTVATLLFLLALVFTATRRRWDEPGATETSSEAEGERVRLRAVLQHPVVLLQVALFFVYTGLEVTVGQWSFTLLTESRQVARETAGLWVTAYWASIGIGRVLFGLVVERLGVDRVLRFSILLAMVGGLLFAISPSPVITPLSLVLFGLGLAPIYPCMMSRTTQQLGKAISAHAVGFQVSAAMIGVAVLPSIVGLCAQRFGLETIAWWAVGMAVTIFALHTILARRAITPELVA